MRFHLDEHINSAVAEGLCRRGIDVTTAVEAGVLGKSDSEHLEFARRSTRVMVTGDADFLALSNAGVEHFGLVLLSAKGRRRADVAQSVGRSVSWVNRVVARFRDLGVAGLLDRREDNGRPKLDEWFLSTLYDVVDGSPRDYGYPRPTWTRELLAKVMHRLTGVKVHPATMSRSSPKSSVNVTVVVMRRRTGLARSFPLPDGRGCRPLVACVRSR